MLIDDVVALYETLDFQRDSSTEVDDPIQFFTRTEGALITNEFVVGAW